MHKLSRSTLEATIKSIPAGIVILEKDGTISYVNNRATDLYGVDPRRLEIQNHSKELMKLLTLKGERYPAKKMPTSIALLEGKQTSDELIIERPNGSQVIISASASPVFDEKGEITAAVGIYEDITERKKAEEALKESEERLKMAQQVAHVGTFEWNIQTGVNKWTPELEAMYGLPTGGFSGTQGAWEQLVYHEDRNQAIKSVSEAIEKGNFEAEFRVEWPNGSIHWMYGRGWVFKDAFGKPLRLIGINIDITERKKAEEALRISVEQARQRAEELQKLMDIVPAAIWISNDPECKVIVGNQMANSFYEAGLGENVSAGSANGTKHDVTRRFFQNGRELLPQELPMQEAASKNIEIKNSEVEVRTPSGKTMTIFGSAKPLVGNDGNVRGCLATFIDITERKKAEEKIEAYSKNLERIVEERTKQLKDAERLAAIGSTAGMVGHDIRNPLHAMTGDVFLAKSDIANLPDSEEKKSLKESLNSIEENIFYINKIVADLQDYARPLRPHTQESDLKVIIEKILCDHGIPPNVEATYEIDNAVRTIIADTDFLKRIITNLALNAVQAMPEGGKLTIHACKDNQTGDNVITVADSGVGIPPDVQEKLFTPMFTTKSKGQGFGLAVVRRLTESLGGSVSFESEGGKGTTFMVRLPPRALSDKSASF